MNKDEYWLLDLVVESWDSLAILVAENIEEALNRPSHGLDRSELISVLERLFARGDLLAKRVDKHITKEIFIPTRTEIEAAFDGRLKCFYGLTYQGGARWEEVSRPRWERYIYAGVYADPKEGKIVGSDRSLVEKYDLFSQYNSDISVVPGSRHWDVLEPWQATYWKELPVGHRLRYSYEWQYKSPYTKPDPAIEKWFREIHNWYTPYAGSLA